MLLDEAPLSKEQHHVLELTAAAYVDPRGAVEAPHRLQDQLNALDLLHRQVLEEGKDGADRRVTGAAAIDIDSHLGEAIEQRQLVSVLGDAGQLP